jgi:hypothetical protein
MEFEWPENVTPNRQSQLAEVLWVLRDGPIEDSSGRAVGLLAERIAQRGGRHASIAVVSGLLKQLERDPFGLIKRDINGKRTLRIELTVDPRQSPFPPSPYKGKKPKAAKAAKAAKAVDDGTDEQQDVIRRLLDEARAQQAKAKAESQVVPAQLVEPEPAVLSSVPQQLPAVTEHSTHDLLLFAVGAINDAIIQLTMQPALDLEGMLAGRFTAAERILERNAELQQELDKAREDVRTLTKANLQLQHLLQSRR